MKNRKRVVVKNEVYSFPSRFGSHSSMLNFDLTSKVFEVTQDESLVVLTDEFGDYVTNRSRLDSKMADPNRYAGYVGKGTSITKDGFSENRNLRLNELLNSTPVVPKYN